VIILIPLWKALLWEMKVTKYLHMIIFSSNKVISQWLRMYISGHEGNSDVNIENSALHWTGGSYMRHTSL